MPHSSTETIGSVFKSIFFSKSDEVKERILCLPFEAKMFFNNSCISFLDGLQTFFRLEKAYYSLQFLTSGFIFPRREDYAASYQSLQTGFDHMADVALLDQPSQEYRSSMCLKTICHVRSQLISFYRSLYDNPLKLLMECVPLYALMEKLEEELLFPEDDVTTVLEPLNTAIRAELRVLSKLLRAQSRIANLHFIDSLLCISNASDELRFIYRIFDLPFTHESRVTPKPPALLSWLTNFYNVLLAKYTLYWFTVLSDSVSNSDETLEIANSEHPSLVTRVINFQNRTSALYVSVFFDAACQDYPYLGHGFVLPGTAGDTPTGVKSFPPIFAAPLGSTLPVAEISSVLMQISGTLNTGDIGEFNKLLYSYDEKLNHTYFIQKLEYRVYLVIVYGGCRSRKDRQVLEFISHLSGLVRLTTLSASLLSMRQTGYL